MGLNTVFSYIYWNEFEPTQGQFNFNGINDIAAWYIAVQEAGLHGVLRFGPYICGERDWGGLPSWLMEIENLVIRENNQPFLTAVTSYVERIGKELNSSQVTQGGPVLMVQVENEYGNYAHDHTYTAALAAILRANFQTVLYTTNAGTRGPIDGGTIPGVLSEIDGFPQSGFTARDEYVTDPTSLGPLIDGEYYVTWYDYYGSNITFQTDTGSSKGTAKVLTDLDWILSNNHSFSLYMFHGGTNWGFGNGGDDFNKGYQSVTTSYDYGAPLDESGRQAPIYNSIKQVIAKYVPAGSIPAFPTTPPLMSTPNITLEAVGSLFGNLHGAVNSTYPVNIEQLGQSRGYVLYEHVATAAASGVISPGDKPRDRVIIYINGVRTGVIDATYEFPAPVRVNLKTGDVLWLFVENLGRADYGKAILDQRKGIVGNVTVGASVLTKWSIFSFPFDTAPSFPAGAAAVPVKANGPPLYYTGTFSTTNTGAAADTFLVLPSWIRGAVWVNGFNLGRYWIVGPQQSLYLPGSVLKSGSPNTIVVLELEPQPGVSTVYGTATREWFNKPDPDCKNC